MFATNEFRHLYVVKSIIDGDFTTKDTKAGDLGFIINDGVLELAYTGMGGPLNTHTLTPGQITSVTFRTAEEDRRPLRKKEIKFSASEKLPMGTVVVVKVRVSPYIGLSPEHDGWMHFSVELNDDTEVSALPALIEANYKEQIKGHTNQALLSLITVEAKGDKIVVSEKEDDSFYRGRTSTRPLQFELYGRVFSDTRIKGLKIDAPRDYTVVKDAYVTNGKELANLEWFAMGDRGDTYREMGFIAMMPDTSYMISPDKEYHIGNIHIAKSYERHFVEKSESDITLVFEDEALGKEFMQKVKDFQLGKEPAKEEEPAKGEEPEVAA